MFRTTPLDQGRGLTGWRRLVLAVLEAVALMRLEEMRQVRQPWAPHSWRTRLCDEKTDWCSCKRTKIHLERVELWFASSGGSCGRTMARRRWDAGSSQIAIAMKRGGSVLDGW